MIDHESLEAWHLDHAWRGDTAAGQPSGTIDAEDTMSDEPKKRTITLTNRKPVIIREDEWPIIASAAERPGSFVNGTPKPDYETDEYSIRVRRHADGRAIVYGVVDAATAWTGTETWRGGELLDHDGDGGLIIGAIRRVGADGHMPDSVMRDVIADLPPEEL